MNMNDVSIETLARAWLEARREEEAARERRQAVAKALADRFPTDEDEVVKRHPIDGGMRIIVTRKLNRSVDTDRLTSEWTSLPETVQAAFRWKAEVNLKNLRALEFASPDGARIAAKFITAKPATPAVEVEEIV